MQNQSTAPAPESAQTVASERLRIRIADGGRIKVDVTMVAQAATQLPALIPEHLRRRLDQASIDLDLLVLQVAAGGFQPGELFQLDDGIETLRVWLE